MVNETQLNKAIGVISSLVDRIRYCMYLGDCGKPVIMKQFSNLAIILMKLMTFLVTTSDLELLFLLMRNVKKT